MDSTFVVFDADGYHVLCLLRRKLQLEVKTNRIVLLYICLDESFTLS